jgi:hypothetical protein
MGNNRGAILLGAGLCLLAACHPMSGQGPQPEAGRRPSPNGAQKLKLKGMIAEGANLSSFITGCASRAGLELEALRPGPAAKESSRRSEQVAVSGGFQGVAQFVACFGEGEVVWELGRLQVRHEPPSFYDYRLELQVSAFQSLTVPSPKFKDPAQAEQWFQALPARIKQATALLSGIYLASELAIETREISLSEKEGSVQGRAASYPAISALMEELQGKGLVRNARVEAIRQINVGNAEKNQEFEIRFDW